MPMEKEDSWEFFNDDFWAFYYGPPKRLKDEKRKEKLDKLKPKDTVPLKPLPRASDDDLLNVLRVKDIDLKIEENTKAHHTDKYECTKNGEEDVKQDEADLVVRRGQDFKISVTFDRPYNVDEDDMYFLFKTGKLAETRSQTHGRFQLDETGNGKHSHDEWSGRLAKKDGNAIIAEVQIPSTCAIGEWSLTVSTKTKGQKKEFLYEHPDDFFILFNPWCKDDTTYVGDLEKGTAEYVLNDHGCVYRGNAYCPKAKEWNFGQFEDGILDAALFVILKCFKARSQYKLSDPVLVARAIAQVVNSSDSDKGILWGRWDGKYEDGESPLDWYGSVRIIRRYMETEKPVKYGQCWVFSGVTTTVCRAVGIPARSVTNYSSAHDTDQSNTIDKFYKRDESGKLVPDSSDDSIWNYHVWNEVWMERPDIKNAWGNNTKYDGWQAIDATPQEKSDGKYTCGPCPVYAIKTGRVNIPYDCGFIFSEVNADQVFWEPTPDGDFRRFKIKADKIGKSISTKEADGKAYSRSFFGNRCDVTNHYKFSEGSEDNRKAVLRAAARAKNFKDVYSDDLEKDDVEFKLLHDADLPLGKDVEVKLTACNKSEYRRILSRTVFSFHPQIYTGSISKQAIKIHEIKEDTELVPGKVFEFKTTLEHREYLPRIDSGRGMNIQVYAFVKATRSRPFQNCVKGHDVEFSAPTLEVELPKCVKRGQEFEAVVTFNNPLAEELTNCKAGYEGRGFKHVTGEPVSSVPAMGKFEKKFTLKAKAKGEFTLTFKFTSKELHFLSGSEEVKVE